ncbi:MAG: hypothetical protein H6673_10155 [Anaerolineales bacterium]|nr:hypothetical protein [Anaerolineales bacterium]
MTTVEVKLRLPNDMLAYLQRETRERNMPLDDVVSNMLTEYFDEPTHEELLAGLQQSLIEVLAGNVRPAREFLAELQPSTDDESDERL